MDHDGTAADGLVGAVVVNDILYFAVLCPNLDPERVRIVVSSPDLELVFSGTVYGACSLA